MRARLFFLAIVAFWLTMNGLLWRSQWGAHSQIGSAVPVSVVWEKILTAPDTSTLDIYDHSNKTGICHWMAKVGDSALTSSRILADDYAPDGSDEKVTGYSLSFEGGATLAGSNRLRFEASLDLATNQDWRNFHLRVSVRPTIWEIGAVAATEKLTLKVEDKNGNWQKTFTFAQLRHPETLLAQLGGTGSLGLLAGAGLTPSQESLSRLAGSLEWQAHEDWVQFGHFRARAYRLETMFLGQRVRLLTSRVGEILVVELPNKITLRSEAFDHF